MRKAWVIVVAAIVAVAVPTSHAASTPRLRLVSQEPLVVRGEWFHPTERVLVTALTMIGPNETVVEGPAGREDVELPPAPDDGVSRG